MAKAVRDVVARDDEVFAGVVTPAHDQVLALNTGRGHCRARIFASTAPRAERPGRGADRGYSFVSMIHHTARGKARPVMG